MIPQVLLAGRHGEHLDAPISKIYALDTFSLIWFELEVGVLEG